MRIIMIVFYLMLILFGVSFAALNADSVQINFYFTTIKMPISLLMTLVFGLGLLLGMFLFFVKYLRLKGEHRKTRNQLRLTKKEIKNLRSIPLQQEH